MEWRSFQHPTWDPDFCARESVRVIDLSDTGDRFGGPKLLGDSKPDRLTKKVGDINAYALEMFARKKKGKPVITTPAVIALIAVVPVSVAYPEAVG
ncbi:unnamed protein product [marine sediment metagenome]|uniref:Uncharacterized protein n=1 Tax=marine sediment metagenome TaxID=412755 RepID=X1SSB3_9ZZZZ